MKVKHILIIVVVAIALGVIISTFANTSTYTDFSEARENPGREFHIIGTLDTTEPIVYDTRVNVNEFNFYMVDKNGEKRKVIHKNNKPQDFEKSEQIVVIGKMEGDDFMASSLLLKCPSKYNDQKKPVKYGQEEFNSSTTE